MTCAGPCSPLTRTDGARKHILELCTHAPRKSGNTIYTTFPWEALCAEVAKLTVQRHERGQLAVATADSGDGSFLGTAERLDRIFFKSREFHP